LPLLMKSRWSTFRPVSRGKRTISRSLALTPKVRMDLRKPVCAYAETAWAGPRAL
jgi:hypothetical protein